MNVKICGITKLEDATVAVDAGADFIGFVFAPSKRYIKPKDAKTIATQINSNIKKVGVFVNESIKNMNQIAKEVGLDYIQLHGDEPAEIAAALPLPVIKAFSIHDVTSDILQTYPCDYFLIDSPGEKYRGGSGKTFDWTKLEQLGMDRGKCMLAGGLTAENVQKAITIARPIGVDVSSGIETNGVKDATKIKQFIHHAKK